MLRLPRQMFVFGIATFYFFYGLVTEVQSLECRNGIENSVAYIYWQKTCSANETACFQSVKCSKIGDTAYEDFEWRCINSKECSNTKGKSMAYYKGIKGICCFTNNCNAYKAPCTDSGTYLTPNWIPFGFALILAYLL